MTNAQKKQVAMLTKAILLHDGLGEEHVDGYEYKKFDVKETTWGNKKMVIITSEVGAKDDDNDMRSVFCRTRRLITVGPRGGMTLLNAKQKSHSTGHRVVYGLVD